MRRCSFVFLSVVLGCGSDDGGSHEIQLKAGDNVQQALIAAKKGDVLVFAPGTYMFTDELSLSAAGVTLRGNGTPDQVIFDFSGQAVGGNGLNVTGGDFVLENITVRDTPGDAVRVSNVTNVTFRKVVVTWTAGSVTANGAYGLYPVHCTNVLVEDCSVSGASDAGIYVGQSMNAMVRGNTVMHNQTGIEIENTTDAEVRDNHSEDNVTGILVFNLPNLPVKTGTRTLVHDNMIIGNNRATFATPGTTVWYLPPGQGMLLLANDFTEIRNNTITGNGSLGIAMISCATAQFATDGAIDCADSAYEGFAEGLYVHDNAFSGNGAAPQGFYAALRVGQTPLPDMLWDGVTNPEQPDTDGTRKLCIQKNGTATFSVVDVSMVKLTSSDLAPHDCTHAALAGVTVTWGQ